MINKITNPLSKIKDVHNNFKYSNIYKLFQGSHMHSIQCMTCYHITKTFEPFIMISLDIQPNSSISELLDNYYTTETRIKDDWVCDKCKKSGSVIYKKHSDVMTVVWLKKKYTTFLNHLILVYIPIENFSNYL
jgi:ubiquitin C-terminal hydrolase